MTAKARLKAFIDWAQLNMAGAQSELNFDSPYQLIVAVILSAQCTDKRVNMHTPAIFEAFPDFESLSKATREQLFPLVQSISFPSSKTEHLIDMAKTVMEKFGGELPTDPDLLQTLPGVGPKTAAVVRAVAFGLPSVAVDTHVFRVTHRIGISSAPTPEATQKELEKAIDSALQADAHHWLLLHGRYVCTARAPKCDSCSVSTICKYYKNTYSK